MRLPAYAERFRAAGYACLVFDYRCFGASGGEPRQLLDVERQLGDWRAALAYARGRDDLDRERLAVWGTSFGGGHALAIGAEDSGIAAVVAQCPFTDGISSALAARSDLQPQGGAAGAARPRRRSRRPRPRLRPRRRPAAHGGADDRRRRDARRRSADRRRRGVREPRLRPDRPAGDRLPARPPGGADRRPGALLHLRTRQRRSRPCQPPPRPSRAPRRGPPLPRGSLRRLLRRRVRARRRRPARVPLRHVPVDSR